MTPPPSLPFSTSSPSSSSTSPSSSASRPISNASPGLTHAQPLAGSVGSHHHMQLPHAAPFILGKRIRDANGDEGEDGVTAVSMGGPARDSGHPQLWSFASPTQEIMVAAVAPAMLGEASSARVGNYLPMAQASLNLLASFSGGPSGAGAIATGRAEEETTTH